MLNSTDEVALARRIQGALCESTVACVATEVLAACDVLSGSDKGAVEALSRSSERGERLIVSSLDEAMKALVEKGLVAVGAVRSVGPIYRLEDRNGIAVVLAEVQTDRDRLLLAEATDPSGPAVLTKVPAGRAAVELARRYDAIKRDRQVACRSIWAIATTEGRDFDVAAVLRDGEDSLCPSAYALLRQALHVRMT